MKELDAFLTRIKWWRDNAIINCPVISNFYIPVFISTPRLSSLMDRNTSVNYALFFLSYQLETFGPGNGGWNGRY